MTKSINIFTDGGSRGNPGKSACAFVIVDDKGTLMTKRGKYLGITTNNVAEYNGIILALEYLVNQNKTLLNRNEEIHFFSDSRLVVSQLNGIFKIKDVNIIKLIFKIRAEENKILIPLKYFLIPREKNTMADRVVNQILDIS